MTKDYLAAARDAERRKAWAEGTYYATMAIAAGAETAAVLNFEAPLTAEQAAAVKDYLRNLETHQGACA